MEEESTEPTESMLCGASIFRMLSSSVTLEFHIIIYYNPAKRNPFTGLSTLYVKN